MVKNCAGLTGGRLKLVHAFYIGMLALKYRTPRGERVIWPNQYTWLLEQGLINWDDHILWGLSEDNIRDKSNADGTAKLLVLGQVSWFVVQSIMRLAHALPLSQLESMTLSYIPLFAITYFLLVGQTERCPDSISRRPAGHASRAEDDFRVDGCQQRV